MRSVIVWLAASLPDPALATLRILPRSGSTAWLTRLRACLAEPPAESPSTMKISAPAAAVAEQSASLPGSRSFWIAVLRLTSFSCRRRMRSSALWMTQSSSLLASAGLLVSQWSNGSRMAFSTMRVAAAVASLSFVWPTNSGSRTKTDSMPAAEIITSSAVITDPRLLPVSSA